MAHQHTDTRSKDTQLDSSNIQFKFVWSNATVIVVSTEVFLANKKVVVFVELPELTIYYIEVFVREIVGDLINIVFFLKSLHSLQFTKHDKNYE